MAVKSRTPRVITRTLANVKSGSECYLDGRKFIKVRSKTLMDTKGKVIVVPDFTMVVVR